MKIELTKDEWEYIKWCIKNDHEINCFTGNDEFEPEMISLKEKLGDEWTEDDER